MKRRKLRKAILLISMLLFPVTLYYLSPYLLIQGGFAGIITGSFIFFIVLFISSLFFGRAFCGWVCPAGGLQDCCTQVSDKRAEGRKLNYIKYFIWVPWILAVAASFITAGGVRRVDFLYFTDHGVSVTGLSGYIMYFFVVGLILTVTLIFGRRSFCHSLCWMAPFMVLGGKIKNKLGYPSLHLSAAQSNCVRCGLCAKGCPMSLKVDEMVNSNKMYSPECILCGECADACPKKAITYGFGKNN